MSLSVKDSSIWARPSTLKAIESYDNRICIGVVREVRNVKDTNELRYMVEVLHKNDKFLVACRMMRAHGGAFNYEDIVMRGYTFSPTSNNQNGVLALAGDVVVVGKLGGNGREGIILGSLTHPARKSFLDSTKGPQYKSEFNGIETSINEDGEWTLTFKGQPTNLDKLKDAPNQPIPEPKYDTDVGTSFMMWDKTGSFTLNDMATDGDDPHIQKLFMDKKNGTFEIDSGKVQWILKKSDQSVKLTAKTYENDSSDSITDKTKNYEIQADDHMHIKTPKFVVEGDKIRLGEEGASEWLILGSTFRQNQKQMNNNLVTHLQTAATQLLTAAAQLIAAGAVPCVPGVPIAPLSPAGNAVLSAAQALLQAMVDIQTFESSGASNNYLSAVSKTK